MCELRAFAGILLATALATIGCSISSPPDEPRAAGFAANTEGALERFPPATYDYFPGMDQVAGSEPGSTVAPQMSADDIKGRNAWLLWTGGNEAFWDWFARHGYGTIDLLQLIDSRQRNDRFARAGLISEPGMRPSTKAEADASYGVYYDRPDEQATTETYSPIHAKPATAVYGYSSGIVGLRLFGNPEFVGSAKQKWNPGRYYEDADYASDPAVIRPYRIGMSCAFCHVAPHPLNPPQDPEHPQWENLSSTIGNQYMRVREVFGNQTQPDNYFYHVLDSQLPGTIDTSLIAADNINNANTMNAVFGLPWRVRRALHNDPEQLSPESAIYAGAWEADEYPDFFPHDLRVARGRLEANPRAVPHVLIDGSDSVGTWLALARVYFNIGSYHQNWVRLHNTILGFRQQEPFRIADAERNSVNWHATLLRVDPMTSFFLNHSAPMHLADAPDGRNQGQLQGSGLPTDPAYQSGRAVFAKSCIACHSSIQPGDDPSIDKKINSNHAKAELAIKALRLTSEDYYDLARGDGELPTSYAEWAAAAVELPEFWKENYLATDIRIPVTITHTNSARAMGTNAMHGNIWEDFASLTYKELDSVGKVGYHDPFAQTKKSFNSPAGGPGYYRVPSLISAWATAPFLHNNALGDFNNDPSVEGRLNAYDDAIKKLLWPEQRTSHDRASLASTEHVSEAQYEHDRGMVWRTTSGSQIQILNHQIPGLLAGVTGWSPTAVMLFPWAPSLIALLVALLLLFNDAIRGYVRVLEKKLYWLVEHFSRIQFLSFLMFAIASIFVAYLTAKYYASLSILESVLAWKLPWLRIEAGLLSLLLSFVAYWIIESKLPLPNLHRKTIVVGGALCLLISAFFAFSFGGFFSGYGGHVRIGPFPRGMPVNLIANIDPKSSNTAKLEAGFALVDYLHLARKRHQATGEPYGESPDLLELFEQRVAPKFMAISKCPDFVMDRGHDYSFLHQFSDQEKRDLIELIKTF